MTHDPPFSLPPPPLCDHMTLSLQVPLGGSERMKAFPALRPQEVTLEGRGHLEAAADITLSSAGN